MSVRPLTLVTLLLLMWAVPVSASESKADEPVDQSVAVSVDKKKPGAMIPEKSFTFEPVVDGSKITHDFLIKNTGDGVLKISKVKTG